MRDINDTDKDQDQLPDHMDSGIAADFGGVVLTGDDITTGTTDTEGF